MKKYLEKVKEIAENLDWNVDIDESYVYFQTYSSAGQDFNMAINIEDTPDKFCQAVNRYYESFDCSQEAYLWLDNTGHGKNGAPYEMIDVYKDMEECEEEIYKLWNKLIEFDWESEEV